MDEPLHPRHPGRGCSTSLIAARGNTVEEGGFFIFFPSGLTKSVGWRAVRPINPTIDAAKKYATQVLDELLRTGHEHDASSTNWVSVIAAVQSIIQDFNGNLQSAIGAKVRRDVEEAERKERNRRDEESSSSTVFTFPAYHEAPAPAPDPSPDTSFDSGGGGDFGGGGSSGDY